MRNPAFWDGEAFNRSPKDLCTPGQSMSESREDNRPEKWLGAGVGALDCNSELGAAQQQALSWHMGDRLCKAAQITKKPDAY